MSIKIEYKGWEFEFDEVPTSDEIEARYEARVAKNEITLPVASPTPLDREEGPYGPEPLEGRRILFATDPASELVEGVGNQLLEMGAELGVSERLLDSGRVSEIAASTPGDVFGFDRSEASETAGDVDGLLYDGTRVEHPGDLDDLHAFADEWRGSLAKCGRVVVLGRPLEGSQGPHQRAARRGMDGFVRTLAKELGPSGSTANYVVLADGAEARLDGPLGFLFSARSAYVNGQRFQVAARGEPHPDRERSRRILEDKTALVTGAARGIGRSTVAQMAQEGAEVVGVDVADGRFYDLEGTPGEELLEEVEQQYGATTRVLDISSDRAPQRIADLAREHDGFDIVVHNAALIRDGMIGNMSGEQWREVLAVNLEAPLILTDRLVEEGLINAWGRVVFISSVAGIAGNIGQANYTTSKAGMLGAIREYAEALADDGTTVNAVASGTVRTRLVEIVPEFYRTASSRLNAVSQMGRPEDVANAITFLASPLAQGINGEYLRVCGGALQGA